MRQLPRFAMWLLKIVSVSDTVVGDIVEQHRNGRSAIWLWREVLIAVWRAALLDVRGHPWMAARGLLVGVGALQIGGPLPRPLSMFLRGPALDWLIVRLGSHPIVMLWATDLHGLPVIALNYLVAGSVVGLFHRAHVGAVLVFAMAISAESLAVALDTALKPWTSGYGYVNLPSPVFHVLSNTALPLLFIPLGGFLALRRQHPRLV